MCTTYTTRHGFPYQGLFVIFVLVSVVSAESVADHLVPSIAATPNLITTASTWIDTMFSLENPSLHLVPAATRDATENVPIVATATSLHTVNGYAVVGSTDMDYSDFSLTYEYNQAIAKVPNACLHSQQMMCDASLASLHTPDLHKGFVFASPYTVILVSPCTMSDLHSIQLNGSRTDIDMDETPENLIQYLGAYVYRNEVEDAYQLLQSSPHKQEVYHLFDLPTGSSVHTALASAPSPNYLDRWIPGRTSVEKRVEYASVFAWDPPVCQSALVQLENWNWQANVDGAVSFSRSAGKLMYALNPRAMVSLASPIYELPRDAATRLLFLTGMLTLQLKYLETFFVSVCVTMLNEDREIKALHMFNFKWLRSLDGNVILDFCSLASIPNKQFLCPFGYVLDVPENAYYSTISLVAHFVGSTHASNSFIMHDVIGTLYLVYEEMDAQKNSASNTIKDDALQLPKPHSSHRYRWAIGVVVVLFLLMLGVCFLYLHRQHRKRRFITSYASSTPRHLPTPMVDVAVVHPYFTAPVT